MRKIVDRFLALAKFLGLSALVSLLIAAVLALWHMMETPQPLESAVPGDDRIYRWKHGHIFYKVLGAENAPPLVLLHTPAVGASAYEMRELVESLAQDYRVYAPDLLGFGLSDHPRLDYSAETYITFCHDFLAYVVAQPATLVASGLSCNYAVAVAERSSELCKRLVLISPIAFFADERAPNMFRQLVQVPLIAALLYPLIGTRVALRYIAAQRYKYANDQGQAWQVPSSTIDYLYAATHQLGAQHATMALLAGKLATDSPSSLENVQQPTLIIWGAQALNGTGSRLQQAQQRELPSAGATQAQITLIEDAGISVHEQRARQVIAAIREWTQTPTPTEKPAPTPVSTPAEAARTDVEVSVAVLTATSTVNTLTEPVLEPETQEEIMTDKKSAAQTTQTTSTSSKGASTVEAYCVKCKAKREMVDPHQVTMKNGRPAMEGTCPICKTKLFRIGAGK